MFNECLEIRWKTAHFCILNSSVNNDFVWEVISSTVFHHQIKHLEVRQKYSAARRFFNSLLGVSSGDETLHLMFDILLIISLSTAVCCMHFECFTSTDGLLTFYQPIRNAAWSIRVRTEFKNPRHGIEYRFFFFLLPPRPLLPCLVVGQGFMAISHFTNHKRKTHQKKPVERWAKFCFPENSLNYWLQKSHWL